MKRVSPGWLLISFFAILIGLAGAYVVKRALTQPPPPAPLVVKTAQRVVVVAALDLPPGRVIRSGDIMNLPLTPQQYAARTWPRVMLTSARQIIGRMVKKPLKKGDPFEPDSFYLEGTGPNVAERLKDGLRAVTITVDSDDIPSKAMPGVFVDVVFRSNVIKDKPQPIPAVTLVILQNVEILAIGENTSLGLQEKLDPKIKHYPVTLAVSPEQATQLKTAEGHGALSLTMRGPEDRDLEPSKGSLTLRELLDLPQHVPPPRPPPPFVTEIYRRGRRSTITFGMGRVAADQSADPLHDSPATAVQPNGPDDSVDSVNANPSAEEPVENEPSDSSDSQMDSRPSPDAEPAKAPGSVRPPVRMPVGPRPRVSDAKQSTFDALFCAANQGRPVVRLLEGLRNS